MPGFDGTGPMGTGPLMGYGRGYCLGYVNAGVDFVPRFGGGGGRGRRCRYYATGLPRWARWSREAVRGAAYVPPPGKETELDMLKEQVANLENAMERARKRIQELEQKE